MKSRLKIIQPLNRPQEYLLICPKFLSQTPSFPDNLELVDRAYMQFRIAMSLLTNVSLIMWKQN